MASHHTLINCTEKDDSDEELAELRRAALMSRKSHGFQKLPINTTKICHGRQSKRRNGLTLKSRSNLIVINPINVSEDHTIIRAVPTFHGNESSPVPEKGPSRFNRHDSESDSSESELNFDMHSSYGEKNNCTASIKGCLVQGENSRLYSEENETDFLVDPVLNSRQLSNETSALHLETSSALTSADEVETIDLNKSDTENRSATPSEKLDIDPQSSSSIELEFSPTPEETAKLSAFVADESLPSVKHINPFDLSYGLTSYSKRTKVKYDENCLNREIKNSESSSINELENTSDSFIGGKTVKTLPKNDLRFALANRSKRLKENLGMNSSFSHCIDQKIIDKSHRFTNSSSSCNESSPEPNLKVSRHKINSSIVKPVREEKEKSERSIHRLLKRKRVTATQVSSSSEEDSEAASLRRGILVWPCIRWCPSSNLSSESTVVGSHMPSCARQNCFDDDHQGQLPVHMRLGVPNSKRLGQMPRKYTDSVRQLSSRCRKRFNESS